MLIHNSNKVDWTNQIKAHYDRILHNCNKRPIKVIRQNLTAHKYFQLAVEMAEVQTSQLKQDSKNCP